MQRIIVVKGHPAVLQNHAAEADEFYSMLEKLVIEMGYTPDFRGAFEMIGRIKAAYLIGHSYGTTTVLDSYFETGNPQVRGIILFDPSGTNREAWNALSIPKKAFISKDQGRWWAEGYAESVFLDDTHYFLNSSSRIREEAGRIIEQGTNG